MSSTTTKSVDKIKLLDQMLEDLAGEEFDEFYEADGEVKANIKGLAPEEDLSEVEYFH